MINEISNAHKLYEKNGETVLNWFHVEKLGKYRVRVKVLDIRSERRQGLALFFQEFKGKIYKNGIPLDIPKGLFKHYVFRQEELLRDELLLEVTADSGCLVFANASNVDFDHDGFECGAMGREFWIEILAEDRYRFHCNDNPSTKTYDHFVFDMEITDG